MARFIPYATIALLLLFVSTCPVDVNDIYNYIFLITDVHNYYGTTCIVIVHSDSNCIGKFVTLESRLDKNVRV